MPGLAFGQPVLQSTFSLRRSQHRNNPHRNDRAQYPHPLTCLCQAAQANKQDPRRPRSGRILRLIVHSREECKVEKVRSQDGTQIAFQRSGTGPPLILVHGVLGSSIHWPIVPLLERRFTVYAVQRRGRGESGDAQPYALEREFEDIAAVADFIGDEVILLGHSFGGHCVLEAALLTEHVRSLIAYEPGPAPVSAGQIDQLQRLLDSGDREGMIDEFLREVVEMPAHELEFLKTSPVYPAMVAAAHTVPRELRAERLYAFEPKRFEQMNVPALLLAGGDSPQVAKATVDRWRDSLPDSRVVELSGQQHIAHYTAPDLFVREVQAFVTES
jgi:pimeloyl-ACP methyl ester carboxylesterase